MSNLPHFENDMNTAMMYKGQHPECFLIVSLEDSDSKRFDDFWANSLIILNLNSNHIITRLSESKNPAGYNQFLSLFKITNTPSIVIFGQNTALITKTFYPYPDPSTLINFFSQSPPAPTTPQNDFPVPPSPETEVEEKPPSKQSQTEPKLQQRQAKTTTKISIQSPSGRSFTHVFEKTDTVGDLKQWIESEFGSDIFSEILVAHTNSPLPEDNSMTLENADLSPSALLKLLSDDQILDIHVEDGQNDVPTLQNRRRCLRCPCNCNTAPFRCFNARGFRWFRIFFSLLNPWGDDPGPNSHNIDQDQNGDNDIWQYRPNPQLSQDMRNALRMQRRNGGTPNQFAEV